MILMCPFLFRERFKSSDIAKSGFLDLKEDKKCLSDLNLNVDVQVLMQLCVEDTDIYIYRERERERKRKRERERERERESCFYWSPELPPNPFLCDVFTVTGGTTTVLSTTQSATTSI